MYEKICSLKNILIAFKKARKGKIYKIVSKIRSKKDTLKIIKNKIKDNSTTYDEIACILASIKNQNKK